MPVADHDAFRDAGLAHLLAVAGLHIGIVMGFAMVLARTGLAALGARQPVLADQAACRRWRRCAAGRGYMLLTGLHVPILRSFVMACLFTLARAGRAAGDFAARPGAGGGALMLAEPQEVPGVSFQMSFSAVLALIAGYDALRPG